MERTELNKLGEFGLIEALTSELTISQPSTKRGVGDDAAVIDHDAQTVVSTDLLVEGVHFDLAYTPLQHLGYKAVVVNLSDIYAMNAHPTQITVSLAISNRFSLESMKELYKGIQRACDYYGVDLIGGDTTSSLKGLTISVTALGEANADQLCYRDGANEGDLIWVSGDLGAAYMGLQVLNREKEVFLAAGGDMQEQLKPHEYIVGRQIKPEARRDVVKYLHEIGVKPTAMIDISDGLSSELMHLGKQSSTGSLIYEANIPIADSTYNQALEFKIDPITCALNGGEDYELLFTTDPSAESKINNTEIDLSPIGKIVSSSKGHQMLSKAGHVHALVAQGWNALN